METKLAVLALAATVFGPVALAQPAPARERTHILLIVADDVGVDKIGVYARRDHPTYAANASFLPATPAIDAVADVGIRFTRAWSDPLCSPTRSAVLTGRHGFRTGVLYASDDLPQAEITLPELLRPGRTLRGLRHASGLFGKWHLGEYSDVSYPLPDDWLMPGVSSRSPNPVLHGFDWFSGHHGGSLLDYWSWSQVRGDVTHTTVGPQGYPTPLLAQEAGAWIADQDGPWFAMVSFNAAHSNGAGAWVPEHGLACRGVMAVNEADAYGAMVECIDAQVAALLDGATIPDAVLQNTLVVFLGDNGTPHEVVEGPFVRGTLGRYGKGTTYESGIRVPLIVADGADWITAQGRPLPGAGRDWVPAAGEVPVPVHAVDLFATLAEVAGVPQAVGDDSVSLLPYLDDPGAAWLRQGVGAYAELHDNALNDWAAFADERYKLVIHRRFFANGCLDTWLYDLDNDPYERTDLRAAEPVVYQGLRNLLDSHPALSWDGDNDGVPDGWLAGQPACPPP